MICVWAAPPTCMSRGLRAYQGVYVRIKGFTRTLRGNVRSGHLAGADSPKTQTTSPLVARCQRFSPRWSAIWAPHGHKSWTCATNRGELRHARVRHAGETPQKGFAWRKTPITTVAEGDGGHHTAGWRDKTRPTPQPHHKEHGTAWPRSP